jgi:hypothetical protein
LIGFSKSRNCLLAFDGIAIFRLAVKLGKYALVKLREIRVLGRGLHL